MSDDEDYNSEEDLDYVPSEGEQVSEEENSGDEEDLSVLKDDDADGKGITHTKRARGKVKKKNAIQARKRRGGIKLDEKDNNTDSGAAQGANGNDESEEEIKRRQELAEQIAKEEEERRKEKEKKRADDLWSSFMSDVKKPARPAAPKGPGLGSLTSQVKSPTDESSKASGETKSETETSEKSGKVTITKVFDFAGEEIKITKEVDADSKEAKAEQKKLEKASQEADKSSLMPSSSPSLGAAAGLKRPAVGGLGSVLNKINKKTKMGTLEKSKIDWDAFKKKEGIDEDLKIHNKGKHGYTERMAFLNRADQRQYEIERDIRLGTSSKR